VYGESEIACFGNLADNYIIIIRLRRMHPIATGVARSVVCLFICVCLFVGHKNELCNNGGIDRDAVWG